MALEKAKIIVLDTNESIPVMFNPTEYSLEASNSYSWKKISGGSLPIAQFSSGEARTLTMSDVIFDTFEEGTDVRVYTKKIADLMEVESDLHSPPICRFVWGSLDFKGVITSITQKFTMFSSNGNPVRAKMNITFKSYESLKEATKETPRQSADRTKHKVIKQGEELWMVASQEYDDPGKWREIAKANAIDNPRNLQTGTNIIVPRLE